MLIWFSHPVVRGILIGFLSAAVIDVRVWRSFQDAKFNITTAAWRWFQGALTGGLTAAGLGAI